MDYTDYTPKVLRMLQTTASDHFGNQTPVMQVTFMVGGHGPFVDTYPLSKFTPELAKQKIAERAAHVKDLTSL